MRKCYRIKHRAVFEFYAFLKRPRLPDFIQIFQCQPRVTPDFRHFGLEIVEFFNYRQSCLCCRRPHRRTRYNRSKKILLCRGTPAAYTGNDNSVTYTDTAKNPLTGQQWYLKNTAQTAYSGTVADGTTDINTEYVHNTDNIKGRGVRVLIVDTGLEKHPDLNVSAEISCDYLTGDSDPSPTDSEDHGTSVAGIIGMKDNNNIGGVGIAPRSILGGRNFLADQTLAAYADAMGLLYDGQNMSCCQSDIDIINQSFGFYLTEVPNMDEYEIYNEAYRLGQGGRGGKGFIYVKAAGNGYGKQNCDIDSSFTQVASCEDASFDPTNIAPENILVSAVNASGTLSSYSATGSGIWAAGTGGEFGYSANRIQAKTTNLLLAYSKFEDSRYKPAMVTTDVTGCTKGYSGTNLSTGMLASFSDFDYPWRATTIDSVPLQVLQRYYGANGRLQSSSNSGVQTVADSTSDRDNKNCDYTNSFNGTSSAAPSVSGVVALMLEANPNLTWRDVKHILATTSTKIDPDYAAGQISISGFQLTIEQAWFNNAVGRQFSNRYGFGLVNAKTAVAAAKNYTANSLGTYRNVSSGVISANSGFADTMTGLTGQNAPKSIQLNISQNLTIENLQVRLNITHNNVTYLMLKLRSPSGTENIIYHPYNNFSGEKNMVNFVISSNAFYGERANGTWTLNVYDIKSDGNTVSNISASLSINGH
ncbi:hypothetical protein CHS0354_026777 [Potamilus streckersoni]|uniref:P/Homo B domain-containing protein n=1 Tax=Potamilus streckersoni TaxID=2493646 RepID=A0AAE0T563_9BIVA|nr:hypothetical protein CHS0354_026777 [Potamilus streckersoni]